MVSHIFKVEKEKPVNLEFYMQKNVVNIAIILEIVLLLIFTIFHDPFSVTIDLFSFSRILYKSITYGMYAFS